MGSNGKPLYSLLGYSMSSLYINDQKNNTLRSLKRCQSCTWLVYIMLIILIGFLSIVISEKKEGNIKRKFTYTLDDIFKGKEIGIKEIDLYATLIIKGTAKEVAALIKTNGGTRRRLNSFITGAIGGQTTGVDFTTRSDLELVQDNFRTNFQVILKEEIKGKSIAFVPYLNVSENNDKTLTVNYYFSKS